MDAITMKIAPTDIAATGNYAQGIQALLQLDERIILFKKYIAKGEQFKKDRGIK